MDQPVEQALHPAALLLVEDLRESRECQRYPLCASIFCRIDHVDAEPFIDAVGRPGATPRHVQGDIAVLVRTYLLQRSAGSPDTGLPARRPDSCRIRGRCALRLKTPEAPRSA